MGVLDLALAAAGRMHAGSLGAAAAACTLHPVGSSSIHSIIVSTMPGYTPL